MNRKEFLTLLATATAGAPFLLGGLPVRAMNQFLDLPPNICEEVKDRVLVIVRLIGGNDGLNTVIPWSQYDEYRRLRPTIGIKENKLNGVYGVDSGLDGNKRFWLNPNMSGFKELYGAGKLALINGVGYPSPNYSHFQSETLMFSGSDGRNKPAKDGMLGRYLASLFPEVAGCPVTEDPLAIVLGSPNAILFYEHECQGIEYNTSGIEGTLFSNLKDQTQKFNKNFSEESQDFLCGFSEEYKELLKYIEGVESLMDRYSGRVMDVFNKGNNFSGAGYKNTSLAKQLQVVARMIRGGSKTKIFQVNLGGFDTHAGQDNVHNSLLEQVSDAIQAFQNDIEYEGLGAIAEKIMIVTFSEFGRTARENGNNGTDHGNMAPFFVIGKGVKAGVYGEHPELPDSQNLNENLYDSSKIKNDYRQVFTTLVQDWLGANDTLVDKMELQEFKGNKKIRSLISKEYNAEDSNCLLGEENIQVIPKRTQLYPNPVIESFTITSGGRQIQKIEIYNIIGTLMVSKEVGHSSEFTYSMAQYKSGIYFVKIYWENRAQETIKILKE